MSHEPAYMSEYLHGLLNPAKSQPVFTRCAYDILSSGVEFDAIAYTGVSGGLIGPVLGFMLRKPLIVVRKPGDKGGSHSHLQVEGDAKAVRYIIADDFVESGKTLRTITTSIDQWQPGWAVLDGGHYQRVEAHPRECVGVITAQRPIEQVDFRTFDDESNVLHFRNLSYKGEP